MAAPQLSSATAVGLCTLHTFLYLSSIYVLPATRIPPPSTTPTAAPPLTRNSPSIVRRRLVAVSVSTALSLFVSARTLAPATLRVALGLSSRSPSEWLKLLVLPLGLTASLFAGSLLVSGLQGELVGQAGWTWSKAKDEYGGWMGLRTYLLGPLTEELVFRSCIVAVSHAAGFSKSQIVFLSPIYFGFAHVHHAYETYVAGGRTALALKRGVLQSTFQLAYTTLFGWYASFLFMRTGSVLPPFLAHAFCNLMGLPPLAWALQVFPDRRTALWTTYLAGIGAFIYGFWRMTEPALFGGSVYWA